MTRNRILTMTTADLLSVEPGWSGRARYLGGSRNSGSHWTLPWSKPDSNLYGVFPVKRLFSVYCSSLFGAGKPFFVPSPTIRFAERAEGVKGPKR
jgi:hypothetical protein